MNLEIALGAINSITLELFDNFVVAFQNGRQLRLCDLNRTRRHTGTILAISVISTLERRRNTIESFMSTTLKTNVKQTNGNLQRETTQTLVLMVSLRPVDGCATMI